MSEKRRKRNVWVNPQRKLKLYYYCNRFNCYEQYKSHVILCMISFQHYKNKEEVLKDYAYYEDEFRQNFNKKEGFSPTFAAFAICIGY
jgi:hypothetical protein